MKTPPVVHKQLHSQQLRSNAHYGCHHDHASLLQPFHLVEQPVNPGYAHIIEPFDLIPHQISGQSGLYSSR